MDRISDRYPTTPDDQQAPVDRFVSEFYNLPEQDKVAALREIIRGLSADTIRQAFNSSLGDSAILQPVNERANSDFQPTSETDSIQEKLREIDSSITHRSVRGKFSGRVQLHGKYIKNAENDGRYTYGERSSSSARLDNLDNMFMTSRDNPLRTCNVLAHEIDRKDPSLSHVSIIYGHRYQDQVYRPTLGMSVQFTLPIENLRELTEIIQENPNTLEEFYQVATGELDDNATIGPLRERREKLLLIDVDTFMQPERFTHPDGGNPFVYDIPLDDKRLDSSGIQQLEVTDLT